MNTILRNLLHVITRFKMAALLTIAGLSIAFAAFLLILMQVNYNWNFAKSHPDSDRIYRLDLLMPSGNLAVVFRPLADMFIASSPHIEAGTLLRNSSPDGITFTVERGGRRENFREQMMAVYPNIGEVFAFDMLEGTMESLKSPDCLILPHHIARKMFGDEPAVGRQLASGGKSYVVGGVYNDFLNNALLQNIIYTPMAPDERLHDWDLGIYYTYIKLDKASNADTVLDSFVSGANFSSAKKGSSWLENMNLRMVPIRSIHFLSDAQFDFTPKSSRQMLLILLTIAFTILLIAGINFTNFSVALIPLRLKGINTRKVLGSGSQAIIGSLVAEAAGIAVVAYVCALGLVIVFARSPFAGLFTADITLPANWSLLAVTAVITLLTGIAAGYYPARYAVSFEPAMVLKGNFGLSPSGKKLRNLLISIQFFASFVLVICSVFIYLQNNYMQTSSLGYDKENLLVTDIPGKMLSNRDAYTNRLKAMGDVETVAYLDFLLSGTDQHMQMTRQFNGQKITFAFLPVISASFLDIIGLDVLAGRNFRAEDERNPSGTVMINETAQKRYSLQVGDKLDANEIIGIIPDIKFASMRKEVEPMLFYLWGASEQRPFSGSYAYIKLKPGAGNATAPERIKAVSEEFDSMYAFNIRPFEQVIDKLYTEEKQLNRLIFLFGFMAVFLSLVGVFGLVVYECEYRRKEIALRKVLGSTSREIIILFNKTYIRILTVCFLLAAPVASYGTYRWLENFAYKTPMYCWVYGISFFFILMITSLTITFQSWRAANANPVKSLKSE